MIEFERKALWRILSNCINVHGADETATVVTVGSTPIRLQTGRAWRYREELVKILANWPAQVRYDMIDPLGTGPTEAQIRRVLHEGGVSDTRGFMALGEFLGLWEVTSDPARPDELRITGYAPEMAEVVASEEPVLIAA